MKNKLAVLLKDAKRKGIEQGMDLVLGIVLVSLENVLPDHLEDEEVGKTMREIEADVNRVYKEVLESVPSGEIDEMAERICFYVDRIRAKRGMDE